MFRHLREDISVIFERDRAVSGKDTHMAADG